MQSLAEYLESKGFDIEDAPYVIKDEWKHVPICKAILEYWDKEIG